MKDIVHLNSLYDIYGSFLTKRQQEYYEAYYFDNYSLSEIAEMFNVSRAAISKNLHETVLKLKDYEQKLQINKINAKLNELLKEEKMESIKNKIKEILDR